MGPRKDAPAAILKAVETANTAGEKKAAEKETVATLRGEIATLRAQLKSAEEREHLAVEKAKGEATAKMHAQLLQRYQEGLRDGASLSHRGTLGSSSGSPAMFGGLSP